ncbi:hypothetical protein H1C71_018305 [Ictidomys tridecemlineatus]|nr:hypothetical protein H1C71_018305 [Ictidomys tridecemlineatus]
MEELSWACRLLGSIFGLNSLDAGSTLPLPQDVKPPPKKILQIFKNMPWGSKFPLMENHGARPLRRTRKFSPSNSELLKFQCPNKSSGAIIANPNPWGPTFRLWARQWAQAADVS